MVRRILTEKDIKLRARLKDSHKGDYGRVKIMAGSACMPGAAALSAMSAAAAAGEITACAAAALRGGAGLVALGVPQSMAAAYQAWALEATLYFFKDDGGFVMFDKEQAGEFSLNCNVIAIGMGMGKNYGAITEYIRFFSQKDITLIIDADGLNALQNNCGLLTAPGRKAEIILTPHLTEFSRLTGNPDIDRIKQSREESAAAFARANNVVVLLKGSETVITDGHNTCINTTGTPALAKGGSGDVLSGLIAGLAANYPPFEAACYGAYFLGRAAESAEKEYGENSVLASDVIRHIKIRL